MACDVAYDTGETSDRVLLRAVADIVVTSRRGFGLFCHFACALNVRNGIRMKSCEGRYGMNVSWIVK